MKTKTYCNKLAALFGIGVALSGMPAYAAVNEVIATGIMPHVEQFGGPGTMTTRRLTIAPGEVLGWHYHPGIGAYTIVKRGTLIIEDGCGGEVVYTAGQAFIEPPYRVHRGKNPGTEEVETIQTFLVAQGTGFSISVPRMCGVPASVEECLNDGWTKFNFPRAFSSQGDAIQYVLTGK